MLVIFYLGVADQLELFAEDIVSQSRVWPNLKETIGLLGLGGLSGVLGVIFVFMVETISSIRNSWLSNGNRSLRQYLMVGFVSVLTAVPLYYELATFSQLYIQATNTSTTTSIYNDESFRINSIVNVNSTTNGSGVVLSPQNTLLDLLFTKSDLTSILPYLLPYFLYRYVATALSACLPLPLGIFTPLFLTGGIFGRLLGERLCQLPGFVNYTPWEYSLLGAAGLATGVTRAISTAVIVYELAGQPHLRLPLSGWFLCIKNYLY
jgi:H+/Cl- antiporter ClcA